MSLSSMMSDCGAQYRSNSNVELYSNYDNARIQYYASRKFERAKQHIEIATCGFDPVGPSFLQKPDD